MVHCLHTLTMSACPHFQPSALLRDQETEFSPGSTGHSLSFPLPPYWKSNQTSSNPWDLSQGGRPGNPGHLAR